MIEKEKVYYRGYEIQTGWFHGIGKWLSVAIADFPHAITSITGITPEESIEKAKIAIDEYIEKENIKSKS